MSTPIVVNGRYELEPLPVAKGGMGEVWFGHDTRLDRRVAVKFVRFPEGKPDEELIRRFVRESRIASRLEHPGVPAIYDAGVHEDRPFLVMQRINGLSVADLVAEQGHLSVGWSAAIAAQACAVLSAAHAASLVHRDLKPSNLMLEPDGGVKILDFGLATAVDLADFSKITNTGQVLGTPSYMAPEQILAGLSGPASDLYALGCTLHEMLCGRQVFAGATTYTIMNKQVDEHPPTVRSRRPDVPAALDELVLALLEKNPEDRPGGADEVYDRLLPFAVDLEPMPGALRPPAAPSPVRRYAAVLSRVFAGERATAKPAPVPPPTSRPSAQVDVDAEQVRDQAEHLIQQRRFNQAADVLAGAVAHADACSAPPGGDPVGLRRQYADALFDSGDYQRAAPAYHNLVGILATVYGPDADEVLACRLREATCHALSGRTAQALTQLDQLLADEERLFGGHAARVLDLRRQIGLLQLGAGQRAAAEQTLTSLLADLRQAHDPDHHTITATTELLAGLRRTAST